MIFGIIMGVVCIVFTILVAIVCFSKMKQALIDENKGKKYSVVCEKCKTKFETTYEDVTSNPFYKSLSVTKGANVKITNYKYMARKCSCPTCNKKTWCEVENYNEVARENMPTALKYIGIYLGSLAILGPVVITVVNLILKIVK